MKALSLKQPWASLLAHGKKTIELRSWSTTHRGMLAICASVGAAPDIGQWGDGPRGVIVAVADLIDVRPATPEDCHDACVATIPPGTFAWIIGDVLAVHPVAQKGRLGLFPIDDSLIDFI